MDEDKKDTKQHQAPQTTFKVLRAIDPNVIGGEKPVQVSEDTKHFKNVHYANAKGGLRVVTGTSEVRDIAKSSALRLLNLVKT